MSSVIRILLVAMLFVAMYNAEDLYVGSIVNSQLDHSEIVKMSSKPSSTRVANVSYRSRSNSKVIRGIAAVDMDKSKASATITSGGVGFTYVNVRLESKRGEGLNYRVQIFAV